MVKYSPRSKYTHFQSRRLLYLSTLCLSRLRSGIQPRDPDGSWPTQSGLQGGAGWFVILTDGLIKTGDGLHPSEGWMMGPASSCGFCQGGCASPASTMDARHHPPQETRLDQCRQAGSPGGGGAGEG